MRSFWFWLAYLVLCLACVRAVDYSRENEGYPSGFLSKCHGSSKPAVITPKSLKKLIISVMGPGSVTVAKWTPYNYYQMSDLAKHPEMDFNKKTFMYVCGYLDNTALPIGRYLGSIYKELGYNVLILDTIEFTNREFPLAVRFVPAIGRHVGEMLANLTTYGLDPKKLELVGLSLGGQTMSFTAKRYREITGRNISTLIGLDPTGPCFRHLKPENRLDRSDADFVMLVATNIDGFGIGTPVGHVSFYVNGGEYQPADIWFIPCTTICSHVKSYIYWAAALLYPNTFIGIQCDSVQQARDGKCYKRQPMVTNTMDLFVDRSKPGIYYLATYNVYPYGLGQLGLEKKHEIVQKQMRLLHRHPTLTI